jgi:outer membrane immunogenic protein
MKKLLLVTASLVALGVAPAVAADLPARTYTKAPPMVQAAYDWSGFYIGINGGGAIAHTTWDLVGIGTEGSHDATGGTVGGQIGYRWQQGPVVFGVEAQGNWADLTGNNASLVVPGDNNSTKIDAFGLFTGQIGYAWNNALLYVKGGAAVVDDKYNITGAFTASASETRWGGTVGVGFDYGFTPNWSFGLEYDHIFLDSSTDNFVSPGGAFLGSDTIHQNVDLFTAHINYKFGGPVVARY